VPVVLLDETLKFISRNYVEGIDSEKDIVYWLGVNVLMWALYAGWLYAYPLFRMVTMF